MCAQIYTLLQTHRKKSQGTHAILLITMIKTFLKKLLETPCTNTSFPSAAVRIMLQYQAKPDLNQYSHIIIKMLIFLATACNSEKLSPRQTLKSPDRHWNHQTDTEITRQTMKLCGESVEYWIFSCMLYYARTG